MKNNYLTYPLKIMNITQNYKDSFSHLKHSTGNYCDYPIDDNCGDNKQNGYFYCPCDEMIVKKIYGINKSASNTLWLESIKPVMTPSFTDYVTIMIAHPNDEDLKNIYVGKKYKRNEIITREGNDGFSTGYHFHISVGRGKFKNTGWLLNSKNSWVINTTKGGIKPENAFFVNLEFTRIISSKKIVFESLNESKIGFIKCKSLNVRNEPNLNAKIVNTLIRNTQVECTQETNSWYKIASNQWIYKKYVTFIKPTDKVLTKKVIAKSLNVRKKPNGKIVNTKSPLAKSTIVSVIKENGNWTQINENRWVFTKYLK